MTVEKNIDRESLRKTILAKRDGLSVEQQQEKSKQILNNLWGISEFVRAEALCVYVNFRSEVATLGLINDAQLCGKTIVAPRTDTTHFRLATYAVTDLEKDLAPGAYGILEPNPENANPVAPATIDVVILPGSVFDINGGRLGYGGGYYDRFLENDAPQACRIGICFELQLVEKVPVLAHDQLLDYLVTEERVVAIKRD